MATTATQDSQEHTVELLGSDSRLIEQALYRYYCEVDKAVQAATGAHLNALEKLQDRMQIIEHNMKQQLEFLDE
jgi:hypothetical protein